MIKFDKNIKFGGQGCPPYGTIMDKINKNYVLPKLIEMEQNKKR